MSDNSYKNWYSRSDRALLEQLGAFIKHHRLEQNKTQDTVAADAGISRSTLSLLERGEVTTLSSFIQVLRVLNLLGVMDAFVVKETVSPLALAQMEEDKRKRARGKKKNDDESSDW